MDTWCSKWAYLKILLQKWACALKRHFKLPTKEAFWQYRWLRLLTPFTKSLNRYDGHLRLLRNWPNGFVRIGCMLCWGYVNVSRLRCRPWVRLLLTWAPLVASRSIVQFCLTYFEIGSFAFNIFRSVWLQKMGSWNIRFCFFHVNYSQLRFTIRIADDLQKSLTRIVLIAA